MSVRQNNPFSVPPATPPPGVVTCGLTKKVSRAMSSMAEIRLGQYASFRAGRVWPAIISRHPRRGVDGSPSREDRRTSSDRAVMPLGPGVKITTLKGADPEEV